MLPCHQCAKIVSNPSDLMVHLKSAHSAHKICNHWYTCSLCNSSFDQLYKFRQHTEKCYKKRSNKDSLQETFLQKINKNYQTYEELANDAALELGCKLAGNINVPRNSVYKTIADTQRCLNLMVEGMQSLVVP